MPDETKQPPRAEGGEPQPAPASQPQGRRNAPQQPQQPAPADRARAGSDADAEPAGDGTPMTRESMDAPSKRTAPKAQKFGPTPGPKELAKIRKARFGDKPGTVRIDAAPANSGPDAPATQLVFVDGSGRVVGREDYVPGNYR